MNQEILKYVGDYNTGKGWANDEREVIDTIRNASVVWKGEEDRHRWWNCYFKVVLIDQLWIGFEDAEANRDESPDDLGFEFDPDTICWAEPVEVRVTEYRRKE